MTKDRFDHIIKNKMESMRMDANSNAWEDFSKRLDSELGPEYEKTIDEQLDAEVHAKMNNLKVSFKSSHWLLLKEKLETQALYLRNLYSTKAFELVIFLLLLITFAQQLPVPVEFEMDKKIYALDHSIQKIDLSSVKPIAKIQKKQSSNHLAGTHYSLTLATQTETPANRNNKLIAFARNSEKNTVHNIQNVVPVYTNAELAQSVKGQLNPIEQLHSLEVSLDYDKQYKQMPVVQATGKIELVEETPEIESWLSMQATFDNNLINTPIDYLYKTAPYSSLAAGLSGGVNYDLKSERIELGTGLSYSNVQYNPQEVVIITGSINEIKESSLQSIGFTYLTVPLNLKFHFINAGSWSAFAQFGFNLNTIISTDYLYLSDPRNLQEPVPVPVPEPGFFSSKPQKTYPLGIFQGGSFSDNVFVQANLGLGVQKNFSEKMGLYASLSYNNHFLNPVGPNDDILNKTSLSLGARYRL